LGELVSIFHSKIQKSSYFVLNMHSFEKRTSDTLQKRWIRLKSVQLKWVVDLFLYVLKRNFANYHSSIHSNIETDVGCNGYCISQLRLKGNCSNFIDILHLLILFLFSHSHLLRRLCQMFKLAVTKFF
jgi:hypothetical protein